MPIAETFEHGLRVPQIVGSLKIQEHRRMLLADQPGAGKTAQAMVALEIDGLLAKPSAILILCNLTGCQLTWAPELRNRMLSQYPGVLADLTDTRGRRTMPSVAKRNDQLGAAMLEAHDKQQPLIVLANYELVRWKHGAAPKLANLWSIVFDAVIIDESHLVLPTKEDRGDKVTQFWYGLMNLVIAPDGLRVPMSGTPDRGLLHNRYGTWKFLWPDSHRSFWAWCRHHFIVTEGSWGGAEIGKLRNEREWGAYEHQHMIRRTKAEMLKGLPPKQWAGEGGVDIPMTQAQEGAYLDQLDLMEMQEAQLIAEGSEESMRKATAFKMQFALRSRQMATCMWDFQVTEDDRGNGHIHGVPRQLGREGSNKLAWILDWLEARGYCSDNYDPTLGKVVIVSYFTEVLRWLKAELQSESFTSEVMDGSTPMVEKQRIESEFQYGGLRIVLLSGFLGVSINLDAADDMIFMDVVHDPDRIEQAEDRIHRASRDHQCTYWRLASTDSIDQVMLQIVDSRYRTTRSIYEGSRGISYARQLLGKELLEVGA